MKRFSCFEILFLCAILIAHAEPEPVAEPVRPSRFIFDMVHSNPGENRCKTRYESPEVLVGMGYNGRVLQLFDSPMLAINWEHFDPDIFPVGSAGRTWVDAKATLLDRKLAANRAAGLLTYALGDMVLLPKSLVAKYGAEKTFSDPRDPQTQKFVRAMIDGVFRRFPTLDGLIIRIGETYLHEAPHHTGKIRQPGNPDETIIPLLRLLREEVCVKRGKGLVFRTWLSFDRSPANYARVDAAIEPHPLLVLAIKHCEDDFHRGTRFSRSIGQGRHPQLIEVQCSREYEGKGAYPNYIARGVIEGFDEHQRSVDAEDSDYRSIGAFARSSPLFAGIWTWTRGGGWDGPYIQDELWPDLNAWVLARWARDVTQPEESIFRRYATERLGLAGEDVTRFRRLALASADAVLYGCSPERGEHSIWWTRDEYINAPVFDQSATPELRARLLARRDESVALWREIVGLADAINFADDRTAEHVRVSCRYGLHLYRIYQAVWHLAALTTGGPRREVDRWLAAYDEAWRDYRALPATSKLAATLYQEKGSPHAGPVEGVDKFIARFRAVPPAP